MHNAQCTMPPAPSCPAHLPFRPGERLHQSPRLGLPREHLCGSGDGAPRGAHGDLPAHRSLVRVGLQSPHGGLARATVRFSSLVLRLLRTLLSTRGAMTLLGYSVWVQVPSEGVVDGCDGDLQPAIAGKKAPPCEALLLPFLLRLCHLQVSAVCSVCR